MEAPEPGELAELVAVLRAVPGVAAVSITPDVDGGPGELSVELSPGADEAGVAAEVATLLRSEFGIGVDPGGVRVVEDAAEVTRTDERLWASVERMHLVNDGHEVTATVTLERAGTFAEGLATGPVTSAGLGLAVASATLAAAEMLAECGFGGRIDVVDVVAGTTGRTATVALTTPSGERLAGAAVVRDDVRQAVIRAVLAALADAAEFAEPETALRS